MAQSLFLLTPAQILNRLQAFSTFPLSDNDEIVRWLGGCAETVAVQTLWLTRRMSTLITTMVLPTLGNFELTAISPALCFVS